MDIDSRNFLDFLSLVQNKSQEVRLQTFDLLVDEDDYTIHAFGLAMQAGYTGIVEKVKESDWYKSIDQRVMIPYLNSSPLPIQQLFLEDFEIKFI